MAKFLDLPVQIRWQIYRHLIRSRCHILIPPSSFFPRFDRPGDHPASHSARRYLDDLSITQVSKQIRYEAGEILGKALHYELDIEQPNDGGWLKGLTKLFEVIHVAPSSTCTTEIRIKITLARGLGTMVSYTRTFEAYEFGTGSWNPWLIANGWYCWTMTWDWEVMTIRADVTASGNVRLISGEAFFDRLYEHVGTL